MPILLQKFCEAVLCKLYTVLFSEIACEVLTTDQLAGKIKYLSFMPHILTKRSKLINREH